MSQKSPYDIFDKKPKRITRPRVLIDLDGVVRDFVGSLIRAYKKVYPEHEVKPVNSRRLEDFFPIGTGIYDFIKDGRIDEIMADADAYPGAVEALHRWKEDFEIVVVTAQLPISRAATYMWIGKNDIPANEVHISFHKSELPGFALLDDFIDNLEEFRATGRLAVCLDQPWNKDWDGPRVKNVDEFFRLVLDVVNREQLNDREEFLTT